MNDHNELNGRRPFHWRGDQNREANVDRLTDAIAAVGKLYNRDGVIVWLDQGKLVALNRDAFREFIQQHVVAVRLVNRGSWEAPKWQEEYFTYQFAQLPRFNPTNERPHPPAETEPDDKALDEIFRRELVWRLPRVQG